jgi:hypothetical protein
VSPAAAVAAEATTVATPENFRMAPAHAGAMRVVGR